jgi:hypothetical protein
MPTASTFVVFGIAAVFTYLLAALPIDRLRFALGQPGWRLTRLIAMNSIIFAFAIDFLKNPLTGGIKHVVAYLPFSSFLDRYCGSPPLRPERSCIDVVLH